MQAMIAAHRDQFPTELTQVPQPSVEAIENDPKLAGFTYQRQQCKHCHVGIKGREKRGDYRGMGCSSCHIPHGQHTQTVGTHWPLSRALTKEMRDGLQRTGPCLGCHREMNNAELWAKVSTPGVLNDAEHIEMLNRLLKPYAASKQ